MRLVLSGYERMGWARNIEHTSMSHLSFCTFLTLLEEGGNLKWKTNGQSELKIL